MRHSRRAVRGARLRPRRLPRGPFVLVFVGTVDEEATASASLYSSETGTWTALSTVHHDDSCGLEGKPSVLAGDAVHFLTYFFKSILRYDLTNLELSVIVPPAVYEDGDALLMTAEDGELALALFDIWAWVAGPDGDPVCALSLVGFAEGTDIIFLHTTHGDFRIELNSLQVKKLWDSGKHFYVFPYMSFYIPGRDRDKLPSPAVTAVN